MRRDGPPAYGKRFLGNQDTKVVHDFDNEKPTIKVSGISRQTVVMSTVSFLNTEH